MSDMFDMQQDYDMSCDNYNYRGCYNELIAIDIRCILDEQSGKCN